MIKTLEVIEDDVETLEEKIEKSCSENNISSEDLINIKYSKSRLVEPSYDSDGYMEKDGHNVTTITSALIIWDDGK